MSEELLRKLSPWECVFIGASDVVLKMSIDHDDTQIRIVQSYDCLPLGQMASDALSPITTLELYTSQRPVVLAS